MLELLLALLFAAVLVGAVFYFVKSTDYSNDDWDDTWGI